MDGLPAREGNMKRALEGRVAVVTGAGGAIGAAVARALAAEGAVLVLVDIAAGKLAATGAELGAAARVVVADLGDPDAIAAAAAVVNDEGGADILVNNAGILSNRKIDATDLAEWRRVQAVNLDGAFLLTRALLPAMRRKGWGRIVNIASYAAKCGGLTAGTAYTVSKAGLVGLTFSIAREVAAEGITVNAIAPAYVMSPMVSEMLTEAQRAEQLAQIPVGRFCRPEEVAHAVTFLASPLAASITGEVIDMNGGLQFD